MNTPYQKPSLFYSVKQKVMIHPHREISAALPGPALAPESKFSPSVLFSH